MYRVIVEAQFSATHHIRLHDGTDEPKHGHDWNVRVTFARSALDDLGMVIDFAEAGRVLKQAIQKLHYADLNELPAFRGRNPTTEVVAQWIFERIVELGASSVERVEVTEAPGCLGVFDRS
jgi:6-pyruvoyltetrahydropterin/6-carboxytetrahydropterin synthase